MVHVVLRDNARNMAKAMDDCGLNSISCMAHALQLAINEAVLSQRAVSDCIAIGRKIVSHFKHRNDCSYQKHNSNKMLLLDGTAHFIC